MAPYQLSLMPPPNNPLTSEVLLDLHGVGELSDDDVDGGRGRLPLRPPTPRVRQARREPLVVAVLRLVTLDGRLLIESHLPPIS